MPVDPTNAAEPLNTSPIGDPDIGIQAEMRALKARVNALAAGPVVGPAIPLGGMIPFGGADEDVPDTYHVCNGQALDREDYADLFALIGITYGVGDGINTFNIPDVRGRVLGMAGTGAGLTNRVLGSTYGEETHVLLDGEMPSHVHSAPGDLPWVLNDSGAGLSQAQAGSDSDYQTAGDFHTQSAGGDAAHNNMQPTLWVNYIMKTSVEA